MMWWKDGGHDVSGPKEEDWSVCQASDTCEPGPPAWAEPPGEQLVRSEGGGCFAGHVQQASSNRKVHSQPAGDQRVHQMGRSTQPTGAVGIRRGSNLPATFPAQDSTGTILETVWEWVTKHLMKAPILETTTTVAWNPSEPTTPRGYNSSRMAELIGQTTRWRWNSGGP